MKVDVYEQYQVWDDKAKQYVSHWHYDNPETLDAKVYEVSPATAIEMFSNSEYRYVKVIKLQMTEAVKISSRIGNIRNMHGELFPGQIWNIDNVSPRVAHNDTIVGFNVFCRLTLV